MRVVIFLNFSAKMSIKHISRLRWPKESIKMIEAKYEETIADLISNLELFQTSKITEEQKEVLPKVEVPVTLTHDELWLINFSSPDKSERHTHFAKWQRKLVRKTSNTLHKLIRKNNFRTSTIDIGNNRATQHLDLSAIQDNIITAV